jgi:hypothetical protein
VALYKKEKEKEQINDDKKTEHENTKTIRIGLWTAANIRNKNEQGRK